MSPETAASAAAPATRRWALLLAAAAAVHCTIGVARVPHAVIGKRWSEVADLQRDGFVVWSLHTAELDGKAAIEELRRTTPENAIVPVRGPFKGALEYAPRLLWPRLCCVDEQLPRDAATRHGRPVADVLLVAHGGALRLEPR